MAINMNKYVDISTIFPSTNVAERAFGGLVITETEMKNPGEDSEYKEAYDNYNRYNVVYLTMDAVGKLFRAPSQNTDGITTPGDAEWYLANGYYGYMSPSGRFASRIAFMKLGPSQEDPEKKESYSEALIRADGQPGITGFGSVTFLCASGGGTSGSSSDEGNDSGGLPCKDAFKQLALTNEGEKLRCKYLIVINHVKGSNVLDPSISVVPASTIANDAEEFKDFKGVCYLAGYDSASAFMPMALLGSTDFNNGTVVNYMFKQFPGEVPTVTTDAEYETFNDAQVNFYGRAQTNGQSLDFYQRGYNTDGIDTSIYCNEMWFKSACESALMQLLLGRERLSADDTGVAFVSNTVTEQCLRAVSNGAFMPKDASSNDIRSIAELLSGIGGTYEDASRIAADVGINGYSVYATLKQPEIVSSVMGKNNKEYTILYYVFYGTADSIRFIKGNDVLI